jgi:hypothetical protein
MKAWLRFRRGFKALLIAAPLLIALGALCFEGSLFYTRHQARRFLREVQELKVGESSTAEVEKLLREYGGWSKPSNDSPCSAPDCTVYGVLVRNQPMEYLLWAGWEIMHMRDFLAHRWIRLGYGRVLGMGAYVARGRVVDISLRMLCQQWDGSVTKGGVHEWGRIPGGLEFLQLREGYAPTFYMQSGGDGGRGIEAKIDSRASPEDRQHAFNLNLECMWTLSGCPDLKSLMPSVWNDAQEYSRQHMPPSEP